MRAVIASALLGFYFAAAAMAAAEERFTILNPEPARAVLKLCSRSVGVEVERFWFPQESDIKPAEAQLPVYARSLGRPIAPIEQYYRQYIGIVVQGNQLLYVNLFHESALAGREWLEQHVPGKRLSPADRWRRELINVCDGGDHYWGVLFEPGRGFRLPEFNGVARLPPNKRLQLTAAVGGVRRG